MARCSGGMAATSERRPPRNATPNPIRPGWTRRGSARSSRWRQRRRSAPFPPRARSSPRWRRSTGRCGRTGVGDRRRAGERDDPDPGDDHVRRAEQMHGELGPSEKKSAPIDQEESTARPARTNGRRTTAGTARALERRAGSRVRSTPARASSTHRRTRSRRGRAGRRMAATRGASRAARATTRRGCRGRFRGRGRDAFVRPTPAGSRRGCRSSSAALAALSAAPVARPWRPRATNSQATESARMKRTVDAISTPSAASRTGRRPTSSETPPGEQQRGEDAERVGRVDEGQRQRREVPELAVGAIERRRRERREQAQADHDRPRARTRRGSAAHAPRPVGRAAGGAGAAVLPI